MVRRLGSQANRQGQRLVQSNFRAVAKLDGYGKILAEDFRSGPTAPTPDS